MLNTCEECIRVTWCMIEFKSEHCLYQEIEIKELPRSREDRRQHVRRTEDRRS